MGVVQGLRVLTALEENLSLVLSTHVRWLTTTWNSSYRRFKASALHAHLHSHVHVAPYPKHIYTHNQNNLLLKQKEENSPTFFWGKGRLNYKGHKRYVRRKIYTVGQHSSNNIVLRKKKKPLDGAQFQWESMLTSGKKKKHERRYTFKGHTAKFLRGRTRVYLSVEGLHPI